MSQFHYGSIQIKLHTALRNMPKMSLNSTMVRFKSKNFSLVPIPEMTSQFHYGSIQIYPSPGVALDDMLVSIPLWFDSNPLVSQSFFLKLPRLNSTMVRFKWLQRLDIHSSPTESQFHYGSIQMFGEPTIEPMFKVSIPLWFDSNRRQS